MGMANPKGLVQVPQMCSPEERFVFRARYLGGKLHITIDMFSGAGNYLGSLGLESDEARYIRDQLNSIGVD